jgi:hypothetical protein
VPIVVFMDPRDHAVVADEVGLKGWGGGLRLGVRMRAWPPVVVGNEAASPHCCRRCRCRRCWFSRRTTLPQLERGRRMTQRSRGRCNACAICRWFFFRSLVAWGGGGGGGRRCAFATTAPPTLARCLMAGPDGPDSSAAHPRGGRLGGRAPPLGAGATQAGTPAPRLGHRQRHVTGSAPCSMRCAPTSHTVPCPPPSPLQSYLCAYEAQGLPAVRVQYGQMGAALDAMHEYVLQCIKCAMTGATPR